MQMSGHTFVKYKHLLLYRCNTNLLRHYSIYKLALSIGTVSMLAFFFLINYSDDDYSEELRKIYGNRRYLTINLETSADECGGLGNMMWRTISLHAIGRLLNRSIYFEAKHKCFYEYKEEFREMFRNNYKIFKFMNPPNEHVKVVSFAEECCRYDPPIRLLHERAQLVKTWGNYFQSYKYLRTLSNKEIRNFFEFAPDIRRRAQKIAQKLFRNTTTSKDFKLCVHTRRGDFIELSQSTKKSFTERAISYILRSIRRRYSSQNVSILLFGDDRNFLNMIDIDPEYTVHIPGIRNRGVDLCFATTQCNALLITAPTSTFSLWIGHLMPAGSPVFYYSCQRECRHISKGDVFPPQWIPLNTDYRGRIEVDDQPF